MEDGSGSFGSGSFGSGSFDSGSFDGVFFGRGFFETLQLVPRAQYFGTVLEVAEFALRAELPKGSLGDEVAVYTNGRSKQVLRAIICGSSRGQAQLSPLQSTRGISVGARVELLGPSDEVCVGDHLLGCTLNSEGEILGETTRSPRPQGTLYRREREPPASLKRKAINKIFQTGIRAIDAFVTIGQGSRMCILAEPGVGKSSLVSMLCESSNSDVNVVALIGERGREIAEFGEKSHSSKKTVVVSSASNEPAIKRIRAADTAMAIAEYFSQQGKSVLLIVDSLSRLARAYREIGLIAGELPMRRGYPLTVFSKLPKFVERSGPGTKGYITAFYTVLISSDIDEDPIVEEIKGLTDGHITLNRTLAEEGTFPAIDILTSISRLAQKVAPEELLKAAKELRTVRVRAIEGRELQALGAKRNSLMETIFETDDQLRSFVGQSLKEKSDFAFTFKELCALARQCKSKGINLKV